MKIKNVIFDLDGTLIDSAQSIISSIKFAFEKAKVLPAQPLTLELIGPPLGEIISNLVTDSDIQASAEIIKNFKFYYDEYGYRETKVYEGISEMLTELRQMNLNLFIATNKRILPTVKIVEYVGWSSIFDELYALDYFVPLLPNKEVMLRRVMQDIGGSNDSAIYIGDRAEDAEAAGNSRLPFLWAAWGYGNSSFFQASDFVLTKPSQLPFILTHNSF